MASEENLIERISRAIAGKGTKRNFSRNQRLRLGIGDDAAVISINSRSDWVLSCDASLEDTHFLANTYPADSIGYKSLVRATSDLAAMGARPRFFLLTLALPEERAGKWLDQFLRGMRRAARLMGIELIGGDTTRYLAISISITVIGETLPGVAARRSGARPGDILYVSGGLGKAHLGLALMRKGASLKYARQLQPHLYPKIPLDLGIWLADKGIATAMMDISDGLSTDLYRLCRSSGVGARIFAQDVPCVQILPAIARKLKGGNVDPLKMALNGGEDYALLFAVPREKTDLLAKAPGASSLAAIGEVTREKTVLLVAATGRTYTLNPGGWDPFRKK